jgi:hypothetical protein
MSWARSLDGETRNTYRISVEKFLGKRTFGSLRSSWDYNVKMAFREADSENGRWMELFKNRLQWRPGFGIRDTETSGFINADNYLLSYPDRTPNILVPCVTVALSVCVTSQRVEISSLISYEKIAVWLCMGYWVRWAVAPYRD